MEPMRDFAQLQLHFVDQIQWRYELIRPLVLFAEGTATQRDWDTHTPPTPCAPSRVASTNRACWGCYPAPSRWCPAAVRHTSLRWCGRLARLKASTRTFITANWPVFSSRHCTTESIIKRSNSSGNRSCGAVAATRAMGLSYASRPRPGPLAGHPTLLSRLA